jgi:hypothetical protein
MLSAGIFEKDCDFIVVWDGYNIIVFESQLE